MWLANANFMVGDTSGRGRGQVASTLPLVSATVGIQTSVLNPMF